MSVVTRLAYMASRVPMVRVPSAGCRKKPYFRRMWHCRIADAA